MEDELQLQEEPSAARRTVICKICGSSCFEDFVDAEGRLALVCCECGVPLVVLDEAVEEVFFWA